MGRRSEMTNRMAIRPYRFALATIIASASVAWIVSVQVGTLQAAMTESAPVPAAQIPQPIADAINSPDRPAADKALDAGPKPDQIMAFYGTKPGFKPPAISTPRGSLSELIPQLCS